MMQPVYLEPFVSVDQSWNSHAFWLVASVGRQEELVANYHIWYAAKKGMQQHFEKIGVALCHKPWSLVGSSWAAS